MATLRELAEAMGGVSLDYLLGANVPMMVKPRGMVGEIALGDLAAAFFNHVKGVCLSSYKRLRTRLSHMARVLHGRIKYANDQDFMAAIDAAKEKPRGTLLRAFEKELGFEAPPDVSVEILASHSVDVEELNDIVTDDPQNLLDRVTEKLRAEVESLDEELYELDAKLQSANFELDIYRAIPEHPETLCAEEAQDVLQIMAWQKRKRDSGMPPITTKMARAVMHEYFAPKRPATLPLMGLSGLKLAPLAEEKNG